ncbi:hypothetical protein Tco_0860498 [Tanacetum coccineum]|uniref:Uncharacterized protein n=1 Tax=Tanacetum coccineum TaxID=301880 RepID=A0ABQ5BIJ0_9ASTR
MAYQDMAPLPPHDQRHIWLHYQVEGYTEEIVHHFEQRLETIFESTYMIGSEMGLDVADTLCFQLGGARRSMIWRQIILALGLYTAEEMVEGGFEAFWLGSERVIPDKGYLSGYWIEISSGMDFLRSAPSYTYIRDPVRRLCHRLISYNIFGRGQYLFKHAEGRKSGGRLSGGHFIGRLAHHFGLVSDDGQRGLNVVTRELPLIDMASCCGCCPRGAEDAPDMDEGTQAVPAPIYAPPLPPPPAVEKEKVIKENSDSIASLRSEVASLKVKGSSDVKKQVQKAHTRAHELENQVENLQLELGVMSSLREPEATCHDIGAEVALFRLYARNPR